MADPHHIADLDQLAARYGTPSEASTRKQVDRVHPTPGAILSALSEGGFDGVTYDRELRPRQRATLY